MLIGVLQEDVGEEHGFVRGLAGLGKTAFRFDVQSVHRNFKKKHALLKKYSSFDKCPPAKVFVNYSFG